MIKRRFRSFGRWWACPRERGKHNSNCDNANGNLVEIKSKCLNANNQTYNLHDWVAFLQKDKAKYHGYRKTWTWVSLQFREKMSPLPAERNTIWSGRGTLYAKDQLFKRELAVKTKTCKPHWVRGTCRGLSRGRIPPDENDRNDGKECAVTKTAWEKVRADPGSRNVSGIKPKFINKCTNTWVYEEQLLIYQHVS